MEEAFRIYLIADRIQDYCDLETLKKLRLVNKEWNEKVNRVLRKRCKAITLNLKEGDVEFKKYQQWDSCLLNREICAELPVAVVMRDILKLTDWRCYCLLGSIWRFNVVSLDIKISGQDEHVATILLQNLPALKELKITFDRFPVADPSRCGVFSSFQPDDVKFRSLESVGFSFKYGTGIPVPDVSFLRQCPSLKTISIAGYNGAGMVFELLERWKQMYLKDPTLIRFCEIRLYIRKNKCSGHARAKILNMVADFINLNQPTCLTLAGSYNYDFPTLFKKLRRWTPGIHTFKAAIPVFPLKEFDVFADLTTISLSLDLSSFCTDPEMYQLKQELEAAWGKVQAKLELSKLGSLSLDLGDSYCDHWTKKSSLAIQQAAIEFPNVTRLHLTTIPIVDLYTTDELIFSDDEGIWFGISFDSFFNACKKFSGLRHLSMEIQAGQRDQEFCFSRTKGASRPEGHLKGLSVLNGLKTLTVVVKDVDEFTSREMLLQSLFYGYEPQVRLSFETKPRLSKRKMIRHKLELSVEEFKQALVESHSLGAKWKAGDLCLESCECYKLTI